MESSAMNSGAIVRSRSLIIFCAKSWQRMILLCVDMMDLPWVRRGTIPRASGLRPLSVAFKPEPTLEASAREGNLSDDIFFYILGYSSAGAFAGQIA